MRTYAWKSQKLKDMLYIKVLVLKKRIQPIPWRRLAWVCNRRCCENQSSQKFTQYYLMSRGKQLRKYVVIKKRQKSFMGIDNPQFCKPVIRWELRFDDHKTVPVLEACTDQIEVMKHAAIIPVLKVSFPAHFTFHSISHMRSLLFFN